MSGDNLCPGHVLARIGDDVRAEAAGQQLANVTRNLAEDVDDGAGYPGVFDDSWDGEGLAALGDEWRVEQGAPSGSLVAVNPPCANPGARYEGALFHVEDLDVLVFGYSKKAGVEAAACGNEFVGSDLEDDPVSPGAFVGLPERRGAFNLEEQITKAMHH